MTAELQHPRHGIVDALNAPIRLSIVAALARVEDIDFASLRGSIEVSDSALSKHAALLEEAGYVALRKGYVGKRPRTWLSLTATGRAALHAHLAALRAIVDGVDA